MTLFSPTHSELVAVAAKWLRKSTYKNGLCLGGPCPIIVTELTTTSPEIPDAIGWHSGRTILIEVKVSRSDFFADAKKSFRMTPEMGLGQIRWYLCPEGLLQPEEMPDKWGLLWLLDSGKIKVKKDPAIQKSNRDNEAYILVSVIRRQAGWTDTHIDGRKGGAGT
jgi:hypothetical protein